MTHLSRSGQCGCAVPLPMRGCTQQGPTSAATVGGVLA